MSEGIPRIHPYVRVSTGRQHNSLEAQADAIDEYVRRQWRDGEYERLALYVEDGVSASKHSLAKRPQGKILIEALKPGDHVVVTKLDRAFRSLRDFVLTLETLNRLGVKVHVLNMASGPLDTVTPIGKLVIHIIVAVAQFESELIGERTRDGFVAARANGKAFNTHPKLGWRFEATDKLKPSGRPYLKKKPDWRQRDMLRLVWETKQAHPEWTQDRIRQYFNYELRIKNLAGSEFSQRQICTYLVRARELLDAGQSLVRPSEIYAAKVAGEAKEKETA